MKNIKKSILVIMIFLLMIKINASTTFNNAPKFVNDYAKKFTNYQRYLVTDSNKYGFINGNIQNGINGFESGGLLNISEYNISKSQSNSSYLFNGLEYFTMSPVNGKIQVIDPTSNSGISLKSYDEKSGIRVVNYVQNGVKLEGNGTLLNPWKFINRYKLDFNYNDTEIKIHPSSVMVPDDGKVTVDIEPTAMYTYSSNDCGGVYENGKLTVSNISSDRICKVEASYREYEVIADANDGEIYDAYDWEAYENNTKAKKSIVYNSSIGAFPLVRKTGHTNKGWYTEKTGGILIDASTVIKTDLNVYAHWEANEYTLTYDSNGGSVCNPSSKKGYYGSTWGELCKPTNSGYTFMGWYDSLDGNNKIEATTIVEGSVTVYAHWKSNNDLTTAYCTNPTYNGEYQSLVNSALVGFTWTTETTRKDAGTQNITASLEPGYYWKNGSNSDITISCGINKRQITLKAGSKSKAYDGVELTDSTCSTTSGSLASGQGAICTMTSGSKIINAGSVDNVIDVVKIEDGSGDNVSGNYTITKSNGTLTITKLNTASTGSCNTLIYTGEEQTLASGAQYASYTNNIKTDAGTYTVTVNANDNYTFSNGSLSKTLTCTISPIILTVPSVPENKTYNGILQYSDIECPEGSTTTGSQSAIDAGTYSQKCTLLSTTNYKWNDNTTEEKKISWNIDAKTVEIEWHNSEFLYDGNQHASTPGVVLAAGEKMGYTNAYWTKEYRRADGTALDPINSAPSNVGRYKMSIKCKKVDNGQANCDNYKFINNTTTYEIVNNNKAIAGSCNTLTYNGNEQTLASGAQNATYTDNTKTKAGTYNVTVTAKAGYTFSDGTSSKTLTCTIKKLNVTIEWKNNTFTYDELPHSSTPSVKLVDGETMGNTATYWQREYKNSSGTILESAPVNAGTYTVSVECKKVDNGNCSNYEFTNKSKSYKIQKAKTATTGSCNTVVYNGSAQTLASGAQYATYTNNSQTNAGTYAVTVTSDSNHTFSDGKTSKTLSCSIIYCQGTLTIPSSPSPKTYNGSSQSSGITCPSGSRASGQTSATNAGTYTQTCSLPTPTNCKWSDGTTTAKSITWIINPKSIGITWGSTTTFTYNGSEQAPTVSINTGVNGETMNITRSTATNASTSNYTSTASCSSVTGGQARCNNYTLTNTTKAFTINKRSITIKATDQSKKYDGSALNADNTCSITSGSLAPNQSYTCTCTGSRTSVGSSTKTLSTVVIKNSSGTNVTGNYNVTKQNGTLTIDDNKQCYICGTSQCTTGFYWSTSNPDPYMCAAIDRSKSNCKFIKITGVTISGPSEVYVGNTITMSYSYTPSNASCGNLKYLSSNTAVATVGEAGGIVKGIKAGTAKITVSTRDGSGKSASKTITVKSKSSSGGSSGGSGGGGCFPKGTKVKTAFGLKNIEEIEDGTLVLAYNEKTGKQEYSKVKHHIILNNLDEVLYTLKFDDLTELKLTHLHRIYVIRNNQKMYVKAEDVKMFDKVLYADGTTHSITNISKESYIEPVYNLEVENNHNFYVGDNNILVHNTVINVLSAQNNIISK